jgi:hypothetical protein
MYAPLSVVVQRDFWDWLLYALSVLAATAAVLLFAPWALDRRRRPEVRFLWELSTNAGESFTSWPPDCVKSIVAGQPYEIRIGIQNVGDKAPENALLNFVVPDCLTLENANSPAQATIASTDTTTGIPPLNRVLFLTPALPSSWTPGNFFLYRFTISYVHAETRSPPIKLRLAFAIADTNFNATGRRWLPSLVSIAEPAPSPAGTPWPPAVSQRRRRLRYISVAAGDQVLCTRGERRVVRDIEIDLQTHAVDRRRNVPSGKPRLWRRLAAAVSGRH